MAQPNQVSTTPTKSRVEPPGNAEFPWDDFDSEWYLDHNYRGLRDDDRQILQRLAEFFGSLDHPGLKHGIDVGTGTNLYPALAMLPLCGRITLRERAKTNCDWLHGEIGKFSDVWDPYWTELSQWPLYQPIGDPRWAMRERARVQHGSIFNLEKNAYDIGTMFFVAESITARDDEFQRATCCFLRSLKSNAPFAAAFMHGSNGYNVAGVRFPAVAITEEHVRKCLEIEGVQRSKVEWIGSSNPLRKGVAMMLVTGRASRR